jgi:hypothetical protein
MCIHREKNTERGQLSINHGERLKEKPNLMAPLHWNFTLKNYEKIKNSVDTATHSVVFFK